MREAQPDFAESTKAKEKKACPTCGSRHYFEGQFNTNCFDKEAGCNWKTVSLVCVDCGANLLHSEKQVETQAGVEASAGHICIL